MLFVATAVFGRVAPTNDYFIDLLIDLRRTRRPSAWIAVIASFSGFVLLGIGIISSTSHFGLAMSGIGSLLLLLGASAGAFLPLKAMWTNEYWKLPPPDTLTADRARALARTMGRVYTVVGVGCVVAVLGGFVGIIPKLIYVGEAPIPTVFLVADFVLIAIGGIVVFRAWRLLQSVQVNRMPANQRR